MLKSIEVQGRTEDEAIEIALQQLGLSRDDVSVEILETAKTGLFGLKNTPAIIKVEYESDDASEDSDSAVKESVVKSKPATAPRRGKPAIENIPADKETCDKITDYLTGLFKLMDLEVGVNLTNDDGTVNVTLSASDPGVLIGRRGETLDALQHLTCYSVNRSPAGRVKIHLDAENYRQRRSEALENLAHRTASKVIKYRRNMTLDPMNAYERHVIHAALQDNNQVSTFSVGNDINRRVVIAYGDNAQQQERSETQQFKEWH